MATQNKNKTLFSIENGPSREDMIFRGLCDGHPKTFEVKFRERFLEIEVIISSISSTEFVKVCGGPMDNADRENWKVNGLARYKTSPDARPQVGLFEAEYNTRIRRGHAYIRGLSD
jgi:hypothetical protein